MTDEQWVGWWCCTWRWMHPKWKSSVGEQWGIDFDVCMGVWRSRHDALLTLLGIPPSAPPEPEPNVIEWLSLTEAQRLQALALVRAICLAAPNDQLPDEQWSWCRGVAKALRPGLWLNENVTDPRAILAGWLGERCWSRLRLLWPPEEAPEPAFNVPARKLDALWRSVLWRVRA
ncbi:type III secretion protein [Pseudomonas sp. B21-054]|uniref:type III secretion protein n=1 Tax=Pseudomonas sp. B21-054 TaxID=2895494 RepID=UPI00222F723E|nr:type III secretion protein [Pseudomonas sp. B21-054]UZE15369.1 type III secretion protein [Pseudomonas sp. B21-054]